jgi:hypothetical protein
MPLNEGAPWVQAAIALLDVRRRDRMLACGADAGHARALAALVGKDGELVVVTEDAQSAEQLAALDVPQLRVLAHRIDGGERFGTFDALLLALPFGPLLPLGAWAELARANLRPGGRLVVDVPGPTLVPELASAWRELALPETRLAPLRGVADDALATALRDGGMRDVHAVLGTHLLHVAAPADLVEAFAAPLGLDNRERLELTHALVRAKGGTGPIDALLHRTRVLALR